MKIAIDILQAKLKEFELLNSKYKKIVQLYNKENNNNSVPKMLYEHNKQQIKKIIKAIKILKLIES